MRSEPCLVPKCSHGLAIAIPIRSPLPTLELLRHIAERDRTLAVQLGTCVHDLAMREDELQVGPGGGRVVARAQLAVDGLQKCAAGWCRSWSRVCPGAVSVVGWS